MQTQKMPVTVHLEKCPLFGMGEEKTHFCIYPKAMEPLSQSVKMITFSERQNPPF